MEMKFILALVCCISNLQYATPWGYSGDKGPANWYKDYANCNKTRQSPIHLSESKSMYKSFPTFKFNGYDTKPSDSFTLENNGHTAQLTLKSYTGMTVNAFGKIFRPWQIHFHWGSNDSQGSEHTMKSDGKNLHPGEMHFVHVNTAYDNVSVALTKYDGLMVFGTIMEIDANGRNNPFVSKLTSRFKNITLAKTSVDLSSFPLTEAFMVANDKYFHYNGSLTTPPCSEAVQWVVFSKKMYISHNQMALFRKLLHNKKPMPNNQTEYLNDNHRPIQAKNNRDVLRSFKSDVDSATSVKISLVSIIVSFLAFISFNFHN